MEYPSWEKESSAILETLEESKSFIIIYSVPIMQCDTEDSWEFVWLSIRK